MNKLNKISIEIGSLKKKLAANPTGFWHFAGGGHKKGSIFPVQDYLDASLLLNEDWGMSLSSGQ